MNNPKDVGIEFDLLPIEPETRVKMANALTRAAHRLGLAEKRVVSMALSKIYGHRHLPQDRRLVAKISALDFAEQFGIDPNTAYDELQACARALGERKIKFEKQGRRGLIITEMRWVGRITYAKGEGWVELSFWHELLPLLVGLEKEFTDYKLKSASALRSVYSWRLLELFAQFKSTGLLTIDIEDFHKAMEAPVSCIRDFGNLRNRIIQPAVDELIEKDGLIIDWSPKKSGRKIIGLVFEFKENPQNRLF